MSHLHHDKKVLNRVKRLKGPFNAVETSLSHDDTSCIEVLQQVAAIKGAVNGLMNELMETYLKTHVISDHTAVNEDELAAFMLLLKRYG